MADAKLRESLRRLAERKAHPEPDPLPWLQPGPGEWEQLRAERDFLADIGADLLAALEAVASLPGFEATEPYGIAVLSALRKARGEV